MIACIENAKPEFRTFILKGLHKNRDVIKYSYSELVNLHDYMESVDYLLTNDQFTQLLDDLYLSPLEYKTLRSIKTSPDKKMIKKCNMRCIRDVKQIIKEIKNDKTS